MNITIEALQAYLSERYSGWANEQSLFMKLVEEIGEVAEVLNKRAGRKASDENDLQEQLGIELADMFTILWRLPRSIKSTLQNLSSKRTEKHPSSIITKSILKPFWQRKNKRGKLFLTFPSMLLRLVVLRQRKAPSAKDGVSVSKNLSLRASSQTGVAIRSPKCSTFIAFYEKSVLS